MNIVNKEAIEDIIKECKGNLKNNKDIMTISTSLLLALAQNLNVERFKNFNINKKYSILKAKQRGVKLDD